MIQHYLQWLQIFFQQHPVLAIWIVLFVAFAESLAVIGTVIPGSVTMTMIGALVGMDIINMRDTFVCATIGAFLGDNASFWFGYYFKERLFRLWPFSKYPNWLSRGEKFFAKHGGKSIVIGRFFGPMRSMVPMVAGMLRMPVLQFQLAAFPSAALWAVMYLTPGMLLGAIALELPPKLASELVLSVLAVILFLWGSLWLMRWLYHRFHRWIDNHMAKLWERLKGNRVHHFLSRVLHQDKSNLAVDASSLMHQSLTKLCFVIILWGLLGYLAWEVKYHGWMTVWNEPVFHFLRSIHQSTWTSFLYVVTLVADKVVMLTAGVLGSCLLWLNHQRKIACHCLVGLFGLSASIFVIKAMMKNPRPPSSIFHSISYSFPSGHTALAVLLAGYVVLFVMPRLRYSTWVGLLAALWVGIVAVSRLYLGAHWLTDIIASILLGLSWLLIVSVLNRRHTVQAEMKISLSWLGRLLLVSCFLMPAMGYVMVHYGKGRQQYQLKWQSLSLTMQQWKQGKWLIKHQNASMQRNRLGYVVAPFNVQYIGSLKHLKQQLILKGWKTHQLNVPLSLRVRRAVNPKQPHHLPFFNAHYHNQKPILLMTFNRNKQAWLLQLWQTTVTVAGKTLWLGNIHRWVENSWYAQLRESWASNINPTALRYQQGAQFLNQELSSHLFQKYIIYPNHLKTMGCNGMSSTECKSKSFPNSGAPEITWAQSFKSDSAQAHYVKASASSSGLGITKSTLGVIGWKK